jgi:hypothetical protein
VRFRTARPQLAVRPGERLLAWAETAAGTVGGTRDALYLPDGTRLPWEEVEAADWDRDEATLVVAEVGTWGEVRRQHRLAIDEPGRLLELVRERVTASIVLQRHVAVASGKGLRVIARRAPRGDRPIAWVYEFDEGVDPEDPAVRDLAEQALAAARAEVE